MAMVVYDDGSEVLICELGDEDRLKQTWFENGGREIELYDRQLVEGVLEITATVRIDPERIIT